jgi:ABC-2 type transport system ATP-binding protein
MELKKMSDIVLQTKNLTKYYGKRLALDHLNLSVRRGCIYGLLGRNGAGKTTAIKLLLGLMKPTCGSSSFFDCDSQQLTPEIRQRIGYVTEGHRLFKWMRIGELQKFQRSFFDGDFDDKLFDDMLDYFELSKKQKIKQLSNGQRAQVSLALAIAPNPELLIMDDPTLGLDAAIRRQFLEGMIQLIQRQGKTILFSSHILSDVERVADRVAVIDKGVLRADCSLEEFRTAVKKVKFTFEKAPPDDIDIPGLLHKRVDHTEIELTLINTTAEQIDNWAKENNAVDHDNVEMNLEDQFIEYTEPVNHKRLFQWEVTQK